MSASETNNVDDLLVIQLADPQALAVQQRFLAEWRAGRRPRLSVYMRRYPAYAEALAELVAALPPDMPSGALAESPVAEGDAEHAGAPGRTSAESFPGRPALDNDSSWRDDDLTAGCDAGVGRALATIFGATAFGASAGERTLPQVAERAADYHATPPGSADATDTPADATQSQPPAPPERD